MKCGNLTFIKVLSSILLVHRKRTLLQHAMLNKKKFLMVQQSKNKALNRYGKLFFQWYPKSPNSDIVVCGSQDNTIHFLAQINRANSMMSGYPLKPSVNYLLTKLGYSHIESEEVTVLEVSKAMGMRVPSPLSLKLHTKPITSLAFSNRGMNLASGSRDGVVVLWDLKSENEESGLSETNK